MAYACSNLVAGKPAIAIGLGILAIFGCSPDTPVKESPLPPGGIVYRQSETGLVSGIEGDRAAPTPNEHQPIVAFEMVPDLPIELAIFESVFWEPADTESLRTLIRSDPRIKGSRVLEVGTGSGLISLCCLKAGAAEVIATDINPKAVQCAEFNARELGVDERFQVRLVPRRSPEAWTVIGPDERFDLIVSNPPWEDAKPASVDQFALYDPGFRLLDSLVSGCRNRLNPGGRMLLAYGCVTAIRRIEAQAKTHGLESQILDDRSLDELPDVFLPGMLIEITVPKESQ